MSNSYAKSPILLFSCLLLHVAQQISLNFPNSYYHFLLRLIYPHLINPQIHLKNRMHESTGTKICQKYLLVGLNTLREMFRKLPDQSFEFGITPASWLVPFCRWCISAKKFQPCEAQGILDQVVMYLLNQRVFCIN